MGKRICRVALLIIFVISSSVFFVACGDPYRNLRLDWNFGDEVSFNEAKNRYEYFLEDESASITLTARVTGGNKDVNRGVDISYNQNEIIDGKINVAPESNGYTTANFKVANGGSLKINVSTKEGDKRLSKEIYIVIPIKDFSFSVKDNTIPIVRGVETDISNELPNGENEYNFLTYLPANTNQRSNITLKLVEENDDIQINGSNIKIAKDSVVEDFKVTAHYSYLRKDGNLHTIETEPVTVKVLTPFSDALLSGQIGLFNNAEDDSVPLIKDANNNYLLELATNEATDYENEQQAFLSFKDGDVNIQDDNYMLLGTNYSVQLYNEINTSNIIGGGTSNNLTIDRASASYGGSFQVNHRKTPITDTFKFYVNYTGYESFFKYHEVTVQVTVRAFPEKIEAYSSVNAHEDERLNELILFNDYNTASIGSAVYLQVLGPRSSILEAQKITASVTGASGMVMFYYDRSREIEVTNGESFPSNVTLYVKNANNEKITLEEDAKITFTSAKAELSIPLKIVPEKVAWQDGHYSTSLFLDVNGSKENDLNLGDFLASWINNNEVKLPEYENLNKDDFVINITNDNIVKVINENGELGLLSLTKMRLSLTGEVGNTVITITTPNGYNLTISVFVIVNLSDDNMFLSLGRVVDTYDNRVLTTSSGNRYDFFASIGDEQAVHINFVLENGDLLELKESINIQSFIMTSSNTSSIYVEHKNRLVVRNYHNDKTEIVVKITGYNWSGGVVNAEPEKTTYTFRFFVGVNNAIQNIYLSKPAMSIFTKNTLNHHTDSSVAGDISDFEKKGEATLHLNINPSTATTYNSDTVTWRLYLNKDSDAVLELKAQAGQSNTGSSLIQGTSSNGSYVYWELLNDGMTIKLWVVTVGSKTSNYSLSFYVSASIQEEYTDFYGEKRTNLHAYDCRITARHAEQIQEIMPDLPFNSINFDLRKMKESSRDDDFIYFDEKDQSSYYTFNYALNPRTPENKKIAVTSSKNLSVKVDYEKQVVTVQVLRLDLNESPKHTIMLWAVDSESQAQSGVYDYGVKVNINIQDGKNVSYEIRTEADLIDMRANTSAYNSSYRLLNNINLSSAWKPIGTKEHPFTGSFYGYNKLEDGTHVNYTITNVIMSDNDIGGASYLGFFGYVKNATIDGVTIVGASITANGWATDNSIQAIGTLVGYMENSIIKNSTIQDGNNFTNMRSEQLSTTQVTNAGIVFKHSKTHTLAMVGGLVGVQVGGLIYNSASNIKINANTTNNDNNIVSSTVYGGGLVGALFASHAQDQNKLTIDKLKEIDASITTLVNIYYPNTHTSGYDVMSLINYLQPNNNNFKNNLNKTSAFGGVVGLNAGIIQNVKTRTIVYGKDNLGGIAGINAGAINSAVVVPTLIGDINIGGAVGTNLAGMLQLDAFGLDEILTIDYDINLLTYNAKLSNDFTNLTGGILDTKVQFLNNRDDLSYLNTAIAGQSNLGGLVGLSLASVFANTNSKEYEFATSFAYNSVFSYVSDVEISNAWSMTNTDKKYYGDIVIIAPHDNQAVGGLVGAANNLMLNTAHFNANINNNGYNGSGLLIAGGVGSLIKSSTSQSGVLIIYNTSVNGYISYWYLDEDNKVTYLTENQNANVGSFVGDASSINNNLQFITSSDYFDWSYNTNELYGYLDKQTGTRFATFYNLQASYSVMQFYTDTQVETKHVKNFAGKKEKQFITLDKYGITMQRPNILAANSFYIDFKTYARDNDNTSITDQITFTKNVVKNGVVTNYFTLSDEGTEVLYSDLAGKLYRYTVAELGGRYSENENYFKLENSGEIVPASKTQIEAGSNSFHFNVYNLNHWHYDNINASFMLASSNSGDLTSHFALYNVNNINNTTGLQVGDDASALIGKNIYLNNNVNDGYALQLGYTNWTNAVNFIVSLPSRDVRIEFKYSYKDVYWLETIKTQEGSNKVDIIKDSNSIVLSYHQVNTNVLKKLNGYYDFNGDGSQNATQTERLYTEYLEAFLRNKNRYNIADILDVITDPIFTSYSDMTFYTNSDILNIEYVDGEVFFNVLGSGHAKVQISSNLNLSLVKEIDLVVIHKVSGIELFSDMSKTNKLSMHTPINVIKNHDKQLMANKVFEMDDIAVALKQFYGNIPLQQDPNFKVGIRFYVLNTNAQGAITSLYHDTQSTPDGFNINGLDFKVSSTDDGWLVFVDCYDIATLRMYGLNKSNYTLMAVPFVFETESNKVIAQIRSEKELLTIEDNGVVTAQGQLFGVNVIDGTFDISTSEKAGANPATPAKMKVEVKTDDVNASVYLSINHLGNYQAIHGLEQAHYFAANSGNITNFTNSKNQLIDVSSILLYKLNDTEIIQGIYSEGRLAFTFDKFVVFVQNIQYLDIHNNILLDASKGIDNFTAEKLAYKKYDIKIEVREEYLYDISKVQEFLLDFYTVKHVTEQDEIVESVILDEFSYTISPSSVQSMRLTHYSQITLNTINTSTGQTQVITDVYPASISNTLVAGYPGLLSINLNPSFARVDYIEITSSLSGGVAVGLEQMLADYTKNNDNTMGDDYIFAGSYSSLREGSTKIPNGIRLINNSYNYVENNINQRGYNGNFYVKTLLPTISSAVATFTITITCYLNGATFTKTLTITPELAPALEFNVDGERDVPIAIGQEVRLTLATDEDGIIDPVNMFELYIENETTYLNSDLANKYIANGINKINDTTYAFTLNFDKSLIGKNFEIKVSAYRIINNNKYEVTATIKFQIALFTVQEITVDRVEDGYLNGNFNQDYSLEVRVIANYCTDKNLISRKYDFEQIQQEIKRSIDKLSARITSNGLYGGYKDYTSDDFKTNGVTDFTKITNWQMQVSHFGEATVDGKRLVTSTWFYNNQPISVNSEYGAFVVSNGRAKYLLSDVKDGQGNSLREPYAVINVRSTSVSSGARITAKTLIQYNGNHANGVGLVDEITTGSYIYNFESTFGFNTVQLSNEENPEPIYTSLELMNMVEGGHYILMEDISVNFWEPLNTSIASLDGNGYVIRINSFADLLIEENSFTNIGLFGTVSSDTILKNIIVEIPPADKNIDETRSSENLNTVDLEIRLHSYAGYKIGIIAGENYGTITNSMVLSNADDYRRTRDELLLSNGKLSQLELEARRVNYYSTRVQNSAFLYNLNRTSSIVKVVAQNSAHASDFRVAGFVGKNYGFITNSAVENISLLSEYYVAGFVCENSGSISSSFYKSGNIVNTKQDTAGAEQNNMGTAGFVVINNAGAEINYSYVQGRDVHEERNISGLYDPSRLSRLVGYEYTFNPLTKDSHAVRMFGSVISSVKFAGGFVYRNNGLVTNSFVNSIVLGDESGGFVYINSGTIKNTYSTATIYKEETYASPFSGVTSTKDNAIISLDTGIIEDSYYLKVDVPDYQAIYEEAIKDYQDNNETNPINVGDLFLGITESTDLYDVVNQEKYVDRFSTNTITKTNASTLTLTEFGEYTSFASFSFNEQESEEGIVNSVWFIPREFNNTSATSPTIASYFKHKSYKANLPQLVSANLKTTSLRYSNFVKHLPENTSIISVLDTLFTNMGYDEAYSIQQSLISLEEYSVNLYSLLRLLYEYPSRLGTTILNEYTALTGDRSYSRVDTTVKRLEYVFGRYEKVDNKEILHAPTLDSAAIFATLTPIEKNNMAKTLLINAINAINTLDLDSASSYFYSYISRDNNNVNISLGGSVLNPYLISSVDKFNTYVLQINSMGEETSFNQSGALRLISDISYNNMMGAKTYRSNFFGDFEGNGLYVNNLRLIADNKLVNENKIEYLGLFGTIGKRSDEKIGTVRNLNINVEELRGAAVKYVGVLAGEINDAIISNVQITADSSVVVTGLNAVGGVAGRIIGNTVLSNVSSSVSVSANYYTSQNNFSANNHTDLTHKFNLYNAVTQNISEVSYAGGIAGIMESVSSTDDSANSRVRGGKVHGNITISGEVVGGLYGYVGANTVVSHSTLLVSENTKLRASAVAGGLVGHSLGIITKSSIENYNQLTIDNAISTIIESDIYKNISTIDINIPNTGVTNLFTGNPHYMGGMVGVSVGSIVQFSNVRVDVANINAKYAGGVIGFSIGTGLSNVYTTASTFAFTSFGGLIGLQSRLDNQSNLINSGFNYAIVNISALSNPSATSKNLIQMDGIVAANLWKKEHKVLNRSNYGIDAPRAQMGSFVGKALSYMENYAYYKDSPNDVTHWYDFGKNTLSQRVKNESVFFMQAYQEGGNELIYEVGNATSVAVNLLDEDKNYMQNGMHVKEDENDSKVVVLNAMEYTRNNVVFAYSGDISSDAKSSNDYMAQFYRYSRLQNYGSLRTLKEIIDGTYILKETTLNNITIKAYDKTYNTNSSNNPHLIINQELATSRVLEDVSSGTMGQLDTDNGNRKNPLLQTIYNNWRKDTWYGVTMSSSDDKRELRSIYLFPSLRTRVYHEIIYVYDAHDLVNNIALNPASTYIIMRDINLGSIGVDWQPLGTKDEPFTGTLKSFGNYKLYNMTSSVSDSESFGLFAYTRDASFFNIHLEINRVGVDSNNVGMLVGHADSTTFQKVSVTKQINELGSTSSSAKNFGGLVGYAIDCVFDDIKIEGISISASNQGANVGAVAGAIESNSLFNIQLNKNFNSMTNVSVKDVTIMTAESVVRASIGGLVGRIDNSLAVFEIRNSTFQGAIKPNNTVTNSNIGGIIGYADYVNLNFVGSEGEISSTHNITQSNIGGIIGNFGKDQHSNFINSLAHMLSNTDILLKSTNSSNIAGGLIGNMHSYAKDILESSYSTGTILISDSGSYAVGGLIGKITDTLGGFDIGNSYSMSKTSLFKWGSTSVGGVVGAVSIDGLSESQSDIEFEKIFKNTIYVHDFMPNSNNFGKWVSAFELIEANSEKLESYGLTNVWEKGQDFSYPLISSPVFDNLQREGASQQPKVSQNVDLYDNKAIILSTSNISHIDLQNSTVYLFGSDYRNTVFNIDSTSAVFGIQTTTNNANINNGGIISRAILNNQTSNLESGANNGYLVYSKVKSASKYNYMDGKSSFSYNLVANDAVYYGKRSETINCENSKLIDVVGFINKDYDFENIWTVILGTAQTELANNLPIFHWELTEENYWQSNHLSSLVLNENVNQVMIQNPHDFAKLAYYINNGGKLQENATVVLNTSGALDLSGKIWTPIGTSQHPFTYTFDGNNQDIINISSTSNNMAGLFGVVKDAHVENLSIKDSLIFNTSLNKNAGMINTSTGNSTINKMYLDNNQIGGRNLIIGGNAGAFVGTNSGTITINESFSTSIVHGHNAGGFVGSGDNIVLQNVYISNGNVSDEFKNLTTIFGLTDASYFGIIAGNLNGNVNVSSSYNSTKIQPIIGRHSIEAKSIAKNFYTLDMGAKDAFVPSQLVSNDELETTPFTGFDWNGIWSRNSQINNNFPAFFTNWASSVALPNYYYINIDQDLEEVDNRDVYIPSTTPTQQEIDFYNNIDNGANNIKPQTIIIYTPSQLAFIAKMVNSGFTFKNWNIMLVARDGAGVSNSIDLVGKGWYAIGHDLINNMHFSGNIYGWDILNARNSQVTIKNISTTNPNSPGRYLGLFGLVKDATISHIRLENVRTENISSQYAGHLVGYGENSYISNIDIVQPKENSPSLQAASYVGGVIGYAKNTNLNQITNGSAVKGSGQFTGGVVGYVEITSSNSNSYSLTQLTNNGSVTMGNNDSGGVIGAVYASSSSSANAILTLSHLTNKGQLPHGNLINNFGGVIGSINILSLHDLDISNLTNEISVIGRNNVGGIIGNLQATSNSFSLSSFENSGDVQGESQVGGIVGNTRLDISGDAAISNMNQSGRVSGLSNYLSGAFGLFDVVNVNSLDINEVRFENNLTTTSSNSNYMGGIFGKLNITNAKNNVRLRDLYTTSLNTTITNGVTNMGGIAGSMTIRADSEVSLTKMENKSTIKGYSNNTSLKNIAGIIGDLDIISDTARLDELHNIGSVTGGEYTAGVVGRAIIITNKIASEVSASLQGLENNGTITGTNYTSGIIGYLVSGIKTNNYHEIEEVSGGLIGVFDAFNSGDVVGDTYVGGIVGYAVNVHISSLLSPQSNSATILNSSIISGRDYVGGFVGAGVQLQITGAIDGSNIVWLINTGNIEASSNYAGGIVGELNKQPIQNEQIFDASSPYYYDKNIISHVENKGNVVGSDNHNNAGGIAGSNNGIIQNVQNFGAVKGKTIVGGIAGNNKTVINLAKNLGKVTGAAHVGGIAGAVAINRNSATNQISVTKITNVENNGTVKASGLNALNIGALIGWLSEEIDNSEYNNNIYFGVDNKNTNLNVIGNPTYDNNAIREVPFNIITTIQLYSHSLSQFTSPTWNYTNGKLHLALFV